MTRACYVGIDPGLDGAVCAIIAGLTGFAVAAIFDMPTLTTKTGTKGKPTLKRSIDGSKLAYELRRLRQGSDDIHVTLEATAMRPAIRPSGHACPVCRQPHLIVNQGMASAGAFMRGGGIIVGILIGLGIPFDEVPANVWTAEVFHGRSEKLDHRKLAAQMYPEIAPQLARVKDDGRADAVLLADYGFRRKGAPF